MKAVGENLRQRRTRLKRKFEKARNYQKVFRLAGCGRDSYQRIFESTKDEVKQRKARKCKKAAEERAKVHGPTHRCGPGEIKYVHARFVSSDSFLNF